MLHADEGLLHSYLDGALPSAERTHLEAHFRECAECRASLDAARHLVARANALLGAVAPPEREMPDYARLRRSKPRRWRVPVAWAASVTAAFATGWYLHVQTAHRDLVDNATEFAGARPQATEQARVAPAPVTVPPAPLATRPAPPAAPRAAPVLLSPSEPKAARGAAKAAPPSALAAADAALEERDRAPVSTLDTAIAVSLLGRAPAALPNRPILRMTRAPENEGGGIVIEQEVGTGTVIRLYQEQVAVRRDAAAPQAQAPAGAAMVRERTSERLARYIGTLRVEIEGPLPADSLSKLLDLVR